MARAGAARRAVARGRRPRSGTGRRSRRGSAATSSPPTGRAMVRLMVHERVRGRAVRHLAAVPPLLHPLGRAAGPGAQRRRAAPRSAGSSVARRRWPTASPPASARRRAPRQPGARDRAGRRGASPSRPTSDTARARRVDRRDPARRSRVASSTTRRCPPQRDQLTQKMPMGSVIKCMAVYDEPFWRGEGLSGQVASDTGPGAHHVRQHARTRARPRCCSASSRHATRASGARARASTNAARRSSTASRATSGPAPRTPSSTSSATGARRSGRRGCYGAHLAPGVLTQFGPGADRARGRHPLGGHRDGGGVGGLHRRRGPLGRAGRPRGADVLSSGARPARSGRSPRLRADTGEPDGRAERPARGWRPFEPDPGHAGEGSEHGSGLGCESGSAEARPLDDSTVGIQPVPDRAAAPARLRHRRAVGRPRHRRARARGGRAARHPATTSSGSGLAFGPALARHRHRVGRGLTAAGVGRGRGPRAGRADHGAAATGARPLRQLRRDGGERPAAHRLDRVRALGDGPVRQPRVRRGVRLHRLRALAGGGGGRLHRTGADRPGAGRARVAGEGGGVGGARRVRLPHRST